MTTPTAKGVKITLFLVDGRPDGLRLLDQANWSGRALDFARADWTEVRDEHELQKPGVYILRGEQDDGSTAIYVGEADELRARLGQHQARTDNWTRATAFVTKDDSLNKAGVKYLESRLIALAHLTRRATMLNGNAPSVPALSRADIAEAEGYLEHMLPVLPILGITAFQVPRKAAEEPAGAVTLVLNSSGITAKGRETGDGFLVEAGATARAVEQASIHPYMKSIRARLLRDGMLRPDGGLYRLVQDQVFGSPSTAAGVLLGRPASGPMEWKDASGRSLKDMREESGPGILRRSDHPPVAASSGQSGAGLQFHEAMAQVLRANGNRPMRPAEIASAINTRGLYRQRSGQPIPSGQVSARLSHYPDLFERADGGIRLREPSNNG